jgi:hypothetical protein
LGEAFARPELQAEIKWHCKYARQNGIHVSPTFMVNGLVQADLGSGDDISAWAAHSGLIRMGKTRPLRRLLHCFNLTKRQVNMSENNYQPPKVWTWDKSAGGAFANINRPISGATHDKELPVGKHPLQLYSLGTPNGQKVTIMLEELLAKGVKEAEYDAWLIRIGEGDQFSSGFVDVNPNSKIPALRDHSTTPPTRVFESGAILLYLAEKFGHFLPKTRPGVLKH